MPINNIIPNNPFRNRVPGSALDYAYDLWQLYKFDFKSSNPRKTKHGDFRVSASGAMQVTVNANLNIYQFLLTYLHEVAHVITWQKYGRKAQPHGPEWKRAFGTLLAPVLRAECFPEDILIALRLYAQSPAATLSGAPLLSLALQKHNPIQKGGIKPTVLIQLNPGDTFRFQDFTYKHISKRRTRILCEQVSTGRRYLIPQVASVEPI